MNPQPLTLIGNEGSPYSRKMRAVLRYRNIPHRWMVAVADQAWVRDALVDAGCGGLA